MPRLSSFVSRRVAPSLVVLGLCLSSVAAFSLEANAATRLTVHHGKYFTVSLPSTSKWRFIENTSGMDAFGPSDAQHVGFGQSAWSTAIALSQVAVKVFGGLNYTRINVISAAAPFHPTTGVTEQSLLFSAVNSSGLPIEGVIRLGTVSLGTTHGFLSYLAESSAARWKADSPTLLAIMASIKVG